MSGREWKPGDVALVQNEYGVWNRAILQVAPGDWKWVYGVAYSKAPLDSPTRPLAVIDPEDRDQVERLREAFNFVSGQNYDREWAPDMQAALHHLLVTSPKPAEPTGLGAVVEDADGTLWTRFTREYDYDAVWSHETSHSGNRAYSSINAVRVLSEGVTA